MPPTNILSKNDSSEWDSFAQALFTEGKISPTAGPNVALVSRSNDILPLSKATSILDVGCGPGEVVDVLISQFGTQIPATAPLKATDFSQGMVDAMKGRRDSRVKAGGPTAEVWKRLEAEVADAGNLKDISDGSLSHIFGGFVYFFLPDPQQGLKEGFKKLQSGGLLAFTSWKSSDWMNAMLSGKELFPQKEWPDLPAGWTSLEGVRKQLEDAGFVDIQVEEAGASWNFETHTEIVKTMSNIPTVASTMAGASEEEWEKYRQSMLKIVKAAVAQEPGQLKGIGLVAIGRKP